MMNNGIQHQELSNYRFLYFVLTFKKFIAVLALFTIGYTPQTLLALDFQLFPFEPKLTKYIQNYHKGGDAKEALEVFFDINHDQFQKKAIENNEPHSRAILMAFYVSILGENADLVLPFTRRLIKYSSGRKAAFGTEVIAYGATKNRKEALDLIVKHYNLKPDDAAKFESLEVLPYLKMSVNHWQTLDILWGCYFATANSLYLEMIAEPLIYWQVPDEKYEKKLKYFAKTIPSPGTKNYIEWVNLLIAQASMFGLTHNATMYPVVYESLVEISKKREDRVGELAKKITRLIKNRTVIGQI